MQATAGACANRKLLGTRGQVFPERYHARILRTPTEVRRALRYLLLNRRRHKALQGWLKAGGPISTTDVPG